MTSPKEPWKPSTESKVASSTVVVLLVLLGVFVVLPLMFCGGCMALGAVAG